MSEASPFISSLRQGRRENRWLLWALVLSLLIHLAIWGGYVLAKKQGWWDKWPVFAWLHRPVKPLTPAVPPTPVPPPEPQLSFLMVPESDATEPKNPQFYANANAHAANEKPEPQQNTPKLNGKQTDVPDTETARRTYLAKTTPQPPAKPSKLEAQPAAQPEKEQTKPLQPQPMVNAGDMAAGKPQDQPQQNEPPHPERPRTLAAVAALHPNQVQGYQMRHAGGVQEEGRPSFDTKGTQVGNYDAQLEQAVEQKWDDLLDARNFAGDCSGRVTVHFYLNYDGTITRATIVDPTTVATTWAYLCMQAITEPAPFAKWPDQMRREIGANEREMTFTFYYYTN